MLNPARDRAATVLVPLRLLPADGARCVCDGNGRMPAGGDGH